MMYTRNAYMPIATYPEVVADGAVLAATSYAAVLGGTLHVTTFAVDIPYMSSGLGDFFVDVPGLARAVEQKSKAECHRLHALVQEYAGERLDVYCTTRTAVLGGVLDAAAGQARYFDVALLPWSGETMVAQDMAQAVVFGSGRPTILVPPSARAAALKHIAIAWDGGRVAARALGDALALLAEGGRVSVLTVQDEKPLNGSNLAGTLASSLENRGIRAKPITITLGERSIDEALQDAALTEGAQILAMGGFGHSRIRDFILGGATRGIFTQVRLPVLLSH
ncbi:nucleotide-binding universal stress UspA family protein [Ochrobactrum sp. P20RRXII]|nr:universal stress protein [Ochrobactrum sp. P20RRXII]NIH75538.1 nucleotide-binding universal stress UspA family protein [Ochrobactrum sp. P20RRXII]